MQRLHMNFCTTNHLQRPIGLIIFLKTTDLKQQLVGKSNNVVTIGDEVMTFEMNS